MFFILFCQHYQCHNERYIANPHEVIVSQSIAQKAVNAASALSLGTPSGYPHVFKDHGHIFKRKQCGKPGQVLLEAPVFADGHIYNYMSKPKDNPGPMRVIFIEKSNMLCGVLGHTDGNAGYLNKCKILNKKGGLFSMPVG